jgi:hypothetical protein
MSPLRWPCKSTRKLADELTGQGHPVSARTVAELLVDMGYSLQATSKQVEGAQHPDRDGQFRSVNEQATAPLGAGQPVISVDTKNKEVLGNLANKGREGQPKATRCGWTCMISPIPRSPRRSLGVYGLGADAGWVSVGDDHDTAARCRGNDPPLVGHGGLPGRPAGDQADHRRRWRVQRRPQPAVEGRARQAGGRDGPCGHGVPPPARHVQVEFGSSTACAPTSR